MRELLEEDDIDQDWKEERRRTFQMALRIILALLPIVLVGGFIALNIDGIKQQYSRLRSEDFIRRAKEALNQEKLTVARMMLQNAYRHTPENTEVIDLFIELLLMEGSPDILQLMLQKHTSNPDLNNARRLLEKALETKRSLVVAPFLQDFLSKFPDDAELHRLCGEIFRNVMMLPQAEHCLQLAQNLDPQNMRIRFDLASLQLTHPDETKSQKARQFLEEVRKSGGEWAYMATRTLADYAWEKNLELAQSLYQETLRHNSEDWLSHLRLFLLSCRQDRDGAGSQIEALWNLAKSKTQKMELLLAILAELGAERVLEWQSKLQKDELDDARIRIVLIAALWDTGKYKEAAALATRQTSLKPPILERAMLQYWTYRCQLALKDEVAARLTMESIKNLMSEDALTAILFSNELFATGQHEIALPLLISAADVKNAGFSIIALESLFNYYKSRSDIDGLIWVHERMLTKFPGNAFIQNNLAMLLSYGQKDSARALKLAESAYFTAPSIPVFVSSYAQILCLNGKTSEALRLIQSIDWTDSQNITEGMKLQRAHVLYLNGMIKEAAECVENINTEGFLAQEIDILNQIKQTATTAVVSP